MSAAMKNCWQFYECAVCGSLSFDEIYTWGLYSRRQHVTVCRDCGVVCLNPRMDEEAYYDFYQNEYYGGTQPKPKSVESLDLWAEVNCDQRAQQIVAHLKEYVGTDARILEVGCGSGNNLIALKLSGFDRLSGIEPAAGLPDRLDTIGINCFEGTLNSFAQWHGFRERFDCVILSHVLEHFVEPQKALAILRDHTKQGSYLYVRVPDFFGHKRVFSQFQIPHSFYFSRTSLERLLASSSFVVQGFFEGAVDETVLLARRDSVIPPTQYVSEYGRVKDYIRQDKGQLKAHMRVRLGCLVEYLLDEQTFSSLRGRLRKFGV